jgi:hypothetical protein
MKAIGDMFEILKKYNFWDLKEIPCGFSRNSYMKKLEPYLGNRLIKVILGQRRSGKSYILRGIVKHLIEQMGIRRINIFYVNMDLMEFDFIKNRRDLKKLLDDYLRTLKPEGRVFVILDEVQEIDGWENLVNSLSQDYTREYEVFISGSNAKLLSGELTTYVSGRYIEVTVFPFSFGEFTEFHGISKNKEALLEYLKKGGMPEILTFTDSEIIRNYTSSLKDSIVLRDIVRRHNLRDTTLLESLLNFMIDSVGSFFSVNKVTGRFNGSGYRTNNETLASYISHITDAYFLHETLPYEIKGRKILSGEKKYYLNDLCFKYYLSSSFDLSISRYLENAVYLDLLRKGYTVYVGRIGGKEIDFIAEREGERLYIQTVYLLADDSVVEREFGNLEKIPDNYPKIVLSLDDVSLGNRKGITHMGAWEFIE